METVKICLIGALLVFLVPLIALQQPVAPVRLAAPSLSQRDKGAATHLILARVPMAASPNIASVAATPATIVYEWLTTADRTNQLTPQAPLSFTVDGAYTPLTIHINEDQTYQAMAGFGASLTDASAWLLSTSPLSTTAMRDLFDPVAGIGLDFLRQPIGASDFTKDATPYSYDDLATGQTDPNLSHFSIAHDEAYIIPLLQQALRFNPHMTVVAAPWSAPAWMKTSQSFLGGDLIHDDYGVYARYLVKFVQAYQASGIPIYAITPQNEPGVFFDYPGMGIDESDFVKNNLGPALVNAGLATRILAWDFNWFSGSFTDYPFTAFGDPGVAPYLAGVAYHCYNGDPAAMTELHNAYPTKEIYETECSGGISRGPAIELLINATRNWAQSVTLWNIALNPQHGPRQGSGCIPCTGLATVDGRGDLSYTDEYYQLGQASKFVHPGAYRIDSNTFGPGAYGSGALEDVAFKNPNGSKVLIVYNGAPATQTFKVEWNGQAFDDMLPAGATATFTWSGAQTTDTYAPPSGPVYYAIDAGGAGVGSFMPDSYFYGGQGALVPPH